MLNIKVLMGTFYIVCLDRHYSSNINKDDNNADDLDVCIL